jgi:hypothetical protein
MLIFSRVLAWHRPCYLVAVARRDYPACFGTWKGTRMKKKRPAIRQTTDRYEVIIVDAADLGKPQEESTSGLLFSLHDAQQALHEMLTGCFTGIVPVILAWRIEKNGVIIAAHDRHDDRYRFGPDFDAACTKGTR